MNDTDGSVATPAPVNTPRAAAEPTDAEVAAMLVATIPGPPVEPGTPQFLAALHELVLRAIAHERQRCATLCLAVRNNAIKTGRFAMLVVGNYHAENQGDHPDAQAAGVAAEQSNLLAQAFDGIARRIRLAPGACPACRGTKRVRSKSIRAADGTPVVVECEACKAPAAAAAAEGEPTDG